MRQRRRGQYVREVGQQTLTGSLRGGLHPQMEDMVLAEEMYGRRVCGKGGVSDLQVGSQRLKKRNTCLR